MQCQCLIMQCRVGLCRQQKQCPSTGQSRAGFKVLLWITFGGVIMTLSPICAAVTTSTNDTNQLRLYNPIFSRLSLNAEFEIYDRCIQLFTMAKPRVLFLGDSFVSKVQWYVGEEYVDVSGVWLTHIIACSDPTQLHTNDSFGGSELRIQPRLLAAVLHQLTQYMTFGRPRFFGIQQRPPYHLRFGVQLVSAGGNIQFTTTVLVRWNVLCYQHFSATLSVAESPPSSAYWKYLNLISENVGVVRILQQHPWTCILKQPTPFYYYCF